MGHYLLILSFMLLLILNSGCARRRIVRERPAPPLPRVEVRPASPCVGAVWVPGHWEWRSRRRGYVWIPGHWNRP